MLRYLEGLGLVAPERTPSGYRQYQARDVMRLRALRDLRARHALDLAGLAFAARLRREPALRAEVEAWLESGEAGAARGLARLRAAQGAGPARRLTPGPGHRLRAMSPLA